MYSKGKCLVELIPKRAEGQSSGTDWGKTPQTRAQVNADLHKSPPINDISYRSLCYFAILSCPENDNFHAAAGIQEGKVWECFAQ